MVSNRDVVRVVLVVVGVGVALYLVWALRQVIGVLVVSTFLALALGPAVYGLERLRVPLVLAILIVYVGIGLAIAGVAVAVVPAVAVQVNGLIDAIPGYIDAARSGDRFGIGQALGRQIDALPSRAEEAVGAVQTVTVGVFSGVVQFVTALVVTFLLLLDGRRLAELFFAQLVPARVREARVVTERSTRPSPVT
jgi:predicted PurR-regulated permease PerM